MKQPIALAAAAVAAMLTALPARAQWQGPSRIDAGGALQVGGEAERYLRVLELAGVARTQPWTIRPLATPSLNGAHPWSGRWTIDSASPALEWRWLRPVGRAALNTTFPYQVIDGPAWTGRGLTAQVSGGVQATWGRVRAQLEPTIFASQNAAFELAPNRLSGDGTLRDARFPGSIDAPQRFGTAIYSRIDPGNSSVTLDLSPMLVGISTAAQSWGPAREFPLVLSAGSGGFAHAFVATKTPLNVWFARLHMRVLAGSLGSSRFAQPQPEPVRWASAMALVFLPRGVDGLEIGASRFISGFSPTGVPTFDNVKRLWSRALRASVPGGDNREDENQVGSAWFRWSLPRAHTEFYGEYFREDYALDLRWFLQYPDDLATYVLGLQHVRTRDNGALRAYRLEVVNGEISSSNKRQRAEDANTGRTRLGGPNPPYLHGSVAHGHTNHGLLLGSAAAYGGAALRVGVDDYDSRGRQSFTFERQLRFDWLPGTPAAVTPRPDVLYSLRAERFRFVGDREIGVTLVPMINLNRNLQPGQDKLNLSAAFSVRGVR